MGKQRPIPSVLTEAQANAILAVPNPDSHTGLRLRTIMATMLYGGLRVSEVCHLTPADIHLASDRRMIEVRDSKRGGCRNVPIDLRLLPWLERWGRERPSEGKAFFAMRWGQGITEPNRTLVWKVVKNAAREAARLHPELGIEPETVKCHTLRHTAASDFYEASRDIMLTGALLGHKSPLTTAIYVHTKASAVREVMDRMATATQ